MVLLFLLTLTIIGSVAIPAHNDTLARDVTGVVNGTKSGTGAMRRVELEEDAAGESNREVNDLADEGENRGLAEQESADAEDLADEDAIKTLADREQSHDLAGQYEDQALAGEYEDKDLADEATDSTETRNDKGLETLMATLPEISEAPEWISTTQCTAGILHVDAVDKSTSDDDASIENIPAQEKSSTEGVPEDERVPDDAVIPENTEMPENVSEDAQIPEEADATGTPQEMSEAVTDTTTITPEPYEKPRQARLADFYIDDH